ncbi:MAG: hypothetical protein KME42_00275 [Tildeniella nuda ZEHNDER 1965/U140]|jgi:hypothetical protein|nr:hypothetical protein [Tildeniella nuda ZEHNDER 1965/U140]
MNPHPVDELPLLELFTRLREAGLPLGITEYQLVLRSLQAGFGIQNREALAKLCRTLWIKSPEEERLFNYHFEQIIGQSAVLSTAVEGASKKRSAKRILWLHKVKWWLIGLLAAMCLVILVVVNIAIYASRNSSTQSTTSQPNPTNSDSTLKPTPLKSPTPDKSVAPSPATPTTTTSPMSLAIVVNIGFLLFCGAICLLIFGVVWLIERLAWLLEQALKRLSRSEQTQAPTKVGTIAATNLSTELIQQIGDEVRAARVVRRRLGADGEVGDRVLTNPEFFPITRRQMKQSWRYLRRFIREGALTDVDIDATIHRVGQQGLLLEPVLVPGRVNRTELLLLIDQDGSMVPFHSLSQRLIDTALQGGRLGKAGVYYFHNCPADYVYHDPVHQEAVAIDDFLAQLNSRTAVLIFSDAGSARGGFNPRRRRATKTFVDDLKQRVRYIAWLNPMPRSRWAGTTAGDIATVIPMFETSRQGLDGAIDVLRGKASKHSAKIDLDSRT